MIPSFNEFENGLWQKNPDGDIRSTYDTILFHIEHYYDERNENVTYEKIETRYEEYLNWYNSKYSGVEERYIPKDDRKKAILKFVQDEMYKKTFNSSNFFQERDPYLFGSEGLLSLKRKHEQFKTRVNNARKKLTE